MIISEEIIVRHCSPTLAGLKTANMFIYKYESRQELKCDICMLNHILSPKGICAVPLRYRENKALIYLYRPEKLKNDLSSPEAGKVLENCGYNCKATGKCISKLIERLKDNSEFPHEIGLFLGYPPEDVEGFIEKRECKMTGFWKVYGDTQEAEKTFEKYRKCMNVYYNCWSKGSSIEKLAVAQH